MIDNLNDEVVLEDIEDSKQAIICDQKENHETAMDCRKDECPRFECLERERVIAE